MRAPAAGTRVSQPFTQPAVTLSYRSTPTQTSQPIKITNNNYSQTDTPLPQDSLIIASVSDNSFKLPIIPITLNNIDVPVLIDSGSSFCILAEHVFIT